MSQIKKDCPEADACGEDIVDPILCGPQICVQNADCPAPVVAEAAAAEKTAFKAEE